MGEQVIADAERLTTASAAPKHADMMHLPLRSSSFVALAWAPLGTLPRRGGLLCAAIGHVCAIYARPDSGVAVNLMAVVLLTPMLHAALGQRRLELSRLRSGPRRVEPH